MATTISEEIAPSTSNIKGKKYTALKKRNYALQRTIGSGYCGIVKLASSKEHECDVAIKIISKFTAPGEYLTKYFPREIETVRDLRHPHIIQYFQTIETTHRIYIIMEYAENGNLFEYIKSRIYINETQSRKLFAQLVDVIEYCHKNEIAHRDIKCENLLLDVNFDLKLSDFGFARKVFKINEHVGLVNTFCGSYAYVAPEILKGQPYNPMIADIWSMGVVLYAMVHGCLPFDDSNYYILIKQIREEVKFPQKPKTSDKCRQLIIRILKPKKIRLSLEEIKTDDWLNEPQENSTTEILENKGSDEIVTESTKNQESLTNEEISMELEISHSS